MDFDDKANNDKILSGNESIFEDSEVSAQRGFSEVPQEVFDYESLKDDGLISKFFNAVSEGLLNNFQNKDSKKLQKFASGLFKENEDFIKLLNDFGCILVHKKNLIEIQCEQFKLTGSIIIESDGNMLFDENSQKILYYISEIIKHSNNMDNIINKNEDDGFYPVGDLVKRTIILDGTEREVLTGMLVNAKGETKQIYYYNGKEVHPDAE